MPDVWSTSRDQVRLMVLGAIAKQWNRDIEERVERSPAGHQEALTDAVMAIIPPDTDIRIHD